MRGASLPYFSCFLLSPGRRYFLNKNLLVTVRRVDGVHLVTCDLSMQPFLCENCMTSSLNLLGAPLHQLLSMGIVVYFVLVRMAVDLQTPVVIRLSANYFLLQELP